MGGILFVYQLAGEGKILIDASGERGTGQFPTVEFAEFGDGPGNLLLGTYHDEYVTAEGKWLFARRRMQIHSQGPSDLSAMPVPSGESRAPTKSASRPWPRRSISF